MSRFIDADMIEYFKTFNPNKGEKTIADMAWRSDIDAIPSADVVEVVRCKDCIHSGTDKCPSKLNDADFYCCQGERSEDEHTD